MPEQVSYFGYGEGQESKSVTVSGRGDKRGGILRQEQPFVDKRRQSVGTENRSVRAGIDEKECLLPGAGEREDLSADHRTFGAVVT